MRPDADTLRRRQQWHYRGQLRPPFAIKPGPGQESAWDYPRPPRIEPDYRPVTVRLGAALLAATEAAARVLETAGPPTYYIPPEDVAMASLTVCEGGNHCEWKGDAVFFDILGGPKRIAWTYPDPYPEFASLAGWIAFYPSPLICHVGGERVQPQPGEYYGGWITPEIVGPFKGDPSVPNDV